MKDQADFRAHLQKYITITDEEFFLALDYFSEETLKKNVFLVKENTKVNNTWWVKKGLLVSSFTDEEGKEHVIQFATENCWITDQNAFYNQARSIFNIVCLEKSELLCLSFQNREKLCKDIPAMGDFFRRKANDSFVKQQKRLLTYMTADAKKRFSLLLDEYPGLQQRVSKKILAAYLGVSRETLSRL